MHDIHQPRIANVNFIDSSTMGPRGDVIAQMDWCVGQIMQQLDSLGLKEKTMIIFTSDNGPILDDGYLDYARELKGEHQPDSFEVRLFVSASMGKRTTEVQEYKTYRDINVLGA